MDNALNQHQQRIVEKLQAEGLRITAQRLGLVKLLWPSEEKYNQHIFAENLFKQARHAGLRLSLATVYNTLNQWADIGLLMRIQPSGSLIYFDTNVSHHHHFFDEASNSLIDIDESDIQMQNLPPPPEGKRITSVDVVLRINKSLPA